MNYPKRITELQEAIADKGWEGVILFWTRDVFYYTGLAQPAWLVVRPDDWAVFVRSGYEFAVERAQIVPERIIPERNMSNVCERMFPGHGNGAKVGSELDILPVNEAEKYASVLGGRELVDASPLVLHQRMVKDEDEVAMHRLAAEAAQKGHLAGLEVLKPGVAEIEFAAAIEHAHRLAGHVGVFFYRQVETLMSRGPMSAGPNLARHSGTLFTLTGVGMSPALPSGPSGRPVKRGELIMVDICPCIEGYHMDQSRMYCPGKAPARAWELHYALAEIGDHLMKSLRPGMVAGDAFELATQKAADLGMADIYLRFPNGIHSHFVGHGVGLEINEPPVLSRGNQEPLRAGMVLALEQHMMQPDGLTVKLEDMVLLEKDGCKLLNITPRTITESG